MKTKKKILEASRLLFNDMGVMNVTLRDVAKSITKSYGNVTYHFPTKEDVIISLFGEMNTELTSLQPLKAGSNLMLYLLDLPKHSYDITFKYLFLTIDYNELKRNYPNLFKEVHVLNEARKEKWRELLIFLRNDGYLNQKLNDDDLDYIMFLSVSVRFAYFQMTDSSSYKKAEYTNIVNQFLQPYLETKGSIVYNSWLQSQQNVV